MNGDIQRSVLARSFATSNVRDNRDIPAPAASMQRRATRTYLAESGERPHAESGGDSMQSGERSLAGTSRPWEES